MWTTRTTTVQNRTMTIKTKFRDKLNKRLTVNGFFDHIRMRSIKISQSNVKSENGFHLREIRPQSGFQLRNPNPDFLDFPFCRSIGKSEKGFAELCS